MGDVLCVRDDTEMDHQEIQSLRQESMEQRDGHEALLYMVRANQLVVALVDDQLAAETRRGDALQRQLE